MARKISSRLIISGTLEAETPLHVGGYGVDVETDLPLARNGKGELYVPGTSLTGVLRAWCEKNFTGKDDKGKDVPIKLIGEMFGPKRQPGIEEGHASFVLIEDAKIIKPKKNVNGEEVEQEILTEIRDGVGIDRIYGTAADKSKFDRAILPKGSKLDFEMIVEIQENEAKTKEIIGNLLTVLSNEKIRLGGSKTRGLGRVKLIDCKVKEEKFTGFDEESQIANILKLFETQDNFVPLQTWLTDEKISEFESKTPKLEIEIEWSPTLPLMNKAAYEGIGVDMLPVTSGFGNEKLALVLAGSSIKGAFRSHAERIMRTLLDIETPNKSDDSQNFSNQIRLRDKNGKDTSLATTLIGEMFGAKKEKDDSSKLGLGALSIDDCYSVESFNQKEWREVEQGTTKDDDSAIDWEISKAIETVQSKMTHQTKIPNPHFHISHHTAIDRFTGGVADGALYSVLAPHNIEWQTIKMSLDFGRTENKKASLMLLLLVLRDLAENRLPLGFATNRGMGEIKIESINLKGKILDDYGLQKNEKGEVVLNGGKISELDETFRNDLAKEWKECLKIN